MGNRGGYCGFQSEPFTRAFEGSEGLCATTDVALARRAGVAWGQEREDSRPWPLGKGIQALDIGELLQFKTEWDFNISFYPMLFNSLH